MIGARRQRDRLHHRRLRGMRDVDHDAEAVHLGHGLAAGLAQAVVQPLAVALAGVRIGELAVAVVRERHVAAAAIVELLDAAEIGADRVGVLDADQGHLLAGLRDAPDVGGGQREFDRVGRDLARQPVNGVELRLRLAVGVGVALRRQRPLADIDDEESRIEPASHHLRQVDLGRQVLGVVAFRREIERIDVDVRVERDDALVNRPGARDEAGVRAGLGVQPVRERQRRQCEHDRRKNGEQSSGRHRILQALLSHTRRPVLRVVSGAGRRRPVPRMAATATATTPHSAHGDHARTGYGSASLT